MAAAVCGKTDEETETSENAVRSWQNGLLESPEKSFVSGILKLKYFTHFCGVKRFGFMHYKS